MLCEQILPLVEALNDEKPWRLAGAGVRCRGRGMIDGL